MSTRYSTKLEGVRISTNPTAERKLFAGGRMGHVQRALVDGQRVATRSHGTLGMIGDGHQTLKVLVTGIAKVCRSKAKVHSHRTTISALVLQIIGAVFWAYLRLRNVRATATDQLLVIEVVAVVILNVAAYLATEVSLVTLEAQVIRIPNDKR